MCGRFTLKTNIAGWVDTHFGESVVDVPQEIAFGYNIAPTMSVLTIARDSQDRLHCLDMLWGLIPPWAKAKSIGATMINARYETVLEKPSFRKPIQTRRCVVAADGYYEWKLLEGGGKQPHWIARPDEQPFVFAGIWEQNKGLIEGDRPLLSVSILTSHASESMADLHHRMPVMLFDDDARRRWLDGEPIDWDELEEICRPHERDVFLLRKVSKRVGNVRNQDASLLETAE